MWCLLDRGLNLWPPRWQADSAPGPEKSILRPRRCSFLPFGRAVSSSGAEKSSGRLKWRVERCFEFRAAEACSEANRLQGCSERLGGREPSAAPASHPLRPPCLLGGSAGPARDCFVGPASLAPAVAGCARPPALASPEDGPAAILRRNVARAEREDVLGRSPVALTLVLFCAVSSCRCSVVSSSS